MWKPICSGGRIEAGLVEDEWHPRSRTEEVARVVKSGEGTDDQWGKLLRDHLWGLVSRGLNRDSRSDAICSC